MTQGKPEETCGEFGGRRNDGSECGRPSGWGTPESTGKCRECKGVNPDGSVPEDSGAPEGNDNAATHRGHRAPELLREDIRDTQYEEIYIASFEALCSRHERIHGTEPNYFTKRRYRRFVLKDIKEDFIDDYIHERQGSGTSDNPLIEEHEQLTEGGVWSEDDANRLMSLMSDLSREIRLGLKDFGLLNDPESQQAEATKSVVELLKSED